VWRQFRPDPSFRNAASQPSRCCERTSSIDDATCQRVDKFRSAFENDDDNSDDNDGCDSFSDDDDGDDSIVNDQRASKN
jgi:hypothetical protein